MLQVKTAIEKATLYTGASDKSIANATLLISGETLEYVGPYRGAMQCAKLEQKRMASRSVELFAKRYRLDHLQIRSNRRSFTPD